MSWLLLFLSGLVEAGWAIGLKASDGLTRPLPTVLTLVGMVVSFVLLSLATRSVPVGTAYAVWVGIGASLTVAFGMASGEESVTALKLLLLLGLLGCVVGLKLVH